MEGVIKQEGEENTGNNEAKKAHQEAVEFVESHRDFFEHYARGAVKIEPAPEGLNTFAFDLEKNTIYVSSRFYKEKGMSEEQTVFAMCHEIEHFLEKKGMVKEQDGEKKFAEYLAEIKKSRAFSLLDNCVADNRENRAVVRKTNSGFRELEVKLYKDDLFPSSDLTMYKDETGNPKSVPKHIQFAQAILREHRLPNEECLVVPEVREKLDELYGIVNKKGERLLDIMTGPNVPMSMRLKLQEQYIVPLMNELLEKDKEEEKEKRKEKGESGEGKSEKSEAGEEIDPNEAFGEVYEEAEKAVPNAAPIDEIEKAFKKWQESKSQNPLDKADKEYAENLGVKPEDLKNYRKTVTELEKVINPESGESVIEELRTLIRRIISERLKPDALPKFPVEEGEELVDPANLVAEVKAGNLEPKVWQSVEVKEKKGKKFGEVEITLVADRSGSMRGNKLAEQRKAAVLFMEALKEFADICDEERIKMEDPLEVRNEIYSFQATLEDKIPLKKISKDLGEKERIEIAGKLSSAPGDDTTDYTVLETIDSSLEKDILDKIKTGELKKIVIVFTDGDSGDKERVKNSLKNLRSKGIVAIGVGITKEGESALTTYAPEARLAEQAEKLTLILGELLKEHLSDL
jgi:hypothetical protein